MITQPKKWPGVLVGIAFALFLIKNPEGAAHAVQTVANAVNTFVNAF